jgi:MSHA biogenesis protein MshK
MKTIFATLLFGLVATQAPAQTLSDPTRPPNAVDQADDGSGSRGPVLQSVVIGPDIKYAVIGGQTVKLGGEYAGARLVQITDSEVVLKSGEGTTVLKLFPSIEKKARR